MTPVEVMEGVSLAWTTSDYTTLRRLLHPRGSWVFVSADVSTFSDPDELVDAIRHAQEKTSYKVYTVAHEALGDRVALASAYLRTPVGKDGAPVHRLARHTFLCEVRNGLFFRSESFPSEAHARAAFDAGWGDEVALPEELLLRVDRQPVQIA